MEDAAVMVIQARELRKQRGLYRANLPQPADQG